MPFVDPVTKTKIKQNEPLPDHIPTSQLLKASGGEVDFKYDHSVYWPALTKMAAARAQARKERWENAGKIIGESEIYLWGGEEGSLNTSTGTAVAGEKAETSAEPAAEAPVAEKANGAADNVEPALTAAVEKLNVEDNKESTEAKPVTAAA